MRQGLQVRPRCIVPELSVKRGYPAAEGSDVGLELRLLALGSGKGSCKAIQFRRLVSHSLEKKEEGIRHIWNGNRPVVGGGHEGAAVVVGKQHLADNIFAVLGMMDMELLCGVRFVAQREGTNHQRLTNPVAGKYTFVLELS